MKTRSPLLSLLLATMAGGCSGLPHIQQGAHAAPSAADTHKVFPDDALHRGFVGGRGPRRL
jgi:hypothetical protein